MDDDAGDEVRRYLDGLLARARDVLGSDLAGAYAAGSLALKAFDPARSDIDVALVCESAVPPEVGRELVARIRHEAFPCPVRGLELVVYRRSVARSGTAEPGFELEVNTGPRMPFRACYSVRDRPQADGWFWYGLDRSILHQSGYALSGPPAAEVFADLAPADLCRLLVEALRWWLAAGTPAGSGPAARTDDAVLGACRALVRIRHGVWLPKVAAGRRLLDDGLPGPLIEAAIAARHGCPPPDARSAREFQQQVLEEIRATR